MAELGASRAERDRSRRLLLRCLERMLADWPVADVVLLAPADQRDSRPAAIKLVIAGEAELAGPVDAASALLTPATAAFIGTGQTGRTRWLRPGQMLGLYLHQHYTRLALSRAGEPLEHWAPHAVRWQVRALLALVYDSLPTATPPSAADFLRAAVTDYLAEYCTGAVSRDHVARVFQVSPAHLSRVFSSDGGESFSACLTRLRLAHAKKLLLHTRMTIAEVAFATGYSSAQYFGNVVRRHLGTSPGRFRRAPTDVTGPGSTASARPC
jgi:AraC-like DNA-binding protein